MSTHQSVMMPLKLMPHGELMFFPQSISILWVGSLDSGHFSKQ